jgi:hypothetical protein
VLLAVSAFLVQPVITRAAIAAVTMTAVRRVRFIANSIQLMF